MWLVSFNKVILPIWGYMEIESWQDGYPGTLLWLKPGELAKSAKLELISIVGLEMSLWHCMVSPCSSFHSHSFAEFYQFTETSRSYRAAEYPWQGAGQGVVEEGILDRQPVMASMSSAGIQLFTAPGSILDLG